MTGWPEIKVSIRESLMNRLRILFITLVSRFDLDLARQWTRGWGWMLLSILGMVVLGIFSPQQIGVLMFAAVKFGFFLFLGYIGHRTYFSRPLGFPNDQEMIEYRRSKAAVICAALIFGGLVI